MVPERINTMRKGLIKIQVSRVNIIAILRVKAFVTHHRVIKTHEEKTATARDTRVFVKGVVRNMLKSITTKHFKPIPTRFLTCDDLKRSSMVTNVRVRRAIEQILRILSSEDDDRELVGIAIIWGYTLAKGKLWWMITMS